MLSLEDKQRNKQQTAERRIKLIEALPLLLDECDMCGSNDGVRVFRYSPTGQYQPTGLRGEIQRGLGWESIKEIAKSNDVLCSSCGEEGRKARKAVRNRRRDRANS